MSHVLGFEVENKYGVGLPQRHNGWIWSWSSSDATKLEVGNTGQLTPKQAGIGGGAETIKVGGFTRAASRIDITVVSIRSYMRFP